MAEIAKTLLKATVGSPKEKGDVIEAGSFAFTTKVGFASAMASVVAAVVVALDYVTGLNLNDSLKIATLGLIGAGILAWAIAAAGDVLARSYASAYVKPRENENEAPKPLLEDFINLFKPSSDPAAPKPLLEQFVTSYAAGHAAPDKAKPSGAAAIIPASPRLRIRTAHDEFHVLAVECGPDTDAIRFLIAGDAKTAPAWVSAGNIEFVRMETW